VCSILYDRELPFTNENWIFWSRSIVLESVSKIIQSSLSEKSQQVNSSMGSSSLDSMSLSSDYANLSSKDIKKLVSDMTNSDNDFFSESGKFQL
jgi:hypothetical protein